MIHDRDQQFFLSFNKIVFTLPIIIMSIPIPSYEEEIDITVEDDDFEEERTCEPPKSPVPHRDQQDLDAADQLGLLTRLLNKKVTELRDDLIPVLLPKKEEKVKLRAVSH